MQKITKFISILTILCLMSACATPKVVERKKYNDEQLTCSQLKDEIKDAENFRQEAMREKGATGTNIIAGIFFWPALAATYGNVNDAIYAADSRKDHLISIYRDKKCQ